MYTKPTGFYAIELKTVSGKVKRFDNYRLLKMAREAAKELVSNYPGSSAKIEKDTKNGWSAVEFIK